MKMVVARSETMAGFALLVMASLLAYADVTTAANSTSILRAVLRGTEGNEGVFGLVAVTETPDESVTVEAVVQGLSDGEHGFHVHVYGDIVGKDDGTAAGGHFNPKNAALHAGPEDAVRHVGDLGNIVSSNGTATYSRTFEADDAARPTIATDLVNSIIGRSFVVHVDPDDLESQPTGAAGPRVAVGVIGFGNHELYEDGNSAQEVVAHITSDDFEVPETLVCKIVGDGITGFGAVQLVDGVAELRASLSGLTPGLHGYHVHLYGEEYEYTTDDLSSVERDLVRTAGHYNPTGAKHGLPGPDTTPRHYGDGGNIEVKSDGTAMHAVSLLGVTDLRHLVGRTCVVHADADDGSDPAGNAGPRIAAGQLGYANPDTDVSLSTDSGGDDGGEDTSGSLWMKESWRSALMLTLWSTFGLFFWRTPSL